MNGPVAGARNGIPMTGRAGAFCLAVRWVGLAVLGGVLIGCADPSVEPQPSWEIAGAAGEGSAQPHLAVGEDGAVALSWLEPLEDAHALRFSTVTEDGWSAPRTVASGSDWVVNWADFPSVTPIGGDSLAAHWLVSQEDGFSYDVMLSLSGDGGLNWAEPFPLNLDETPTEHGFVSLFSWGAGFAAVWLDGRNRFQDGEFVFESAAGEPLGAGLRYASFDREGERLATEELDALVCDCCQTDVALSGGDALLVYRDRTTDEVRDIVLRRLSAEGWQPPLALPADNWVIDACPINGPAIDARGEQVAVAWFSAVDNQPLVHLARSYDGGRSFNDSMEVDSSGSFGNVDVAALADGDTAVSWLRTDQDGLALTVRVFPRSGEPGEPLDVAAIDMARPLDFPQMAYHDGRLIFAWTDFGDGNRLRTAVVDLR